MSDKIKQVRFGVSVHTWRGEVTTANANDFEMDLEGNWLTMVDKSPKKTRVKVPYTNIRQVIFESETNSDKTGTAKARTAKKD